MTLDEALKKCDITQFFARKAWIDEGVITQLITSSESIEKLQINLTPESLMADDWDIYAIKL